MAERDVWAALKKSEGKPRYMRRLEVKSVAGWPDVFAMINREAVFLELKELDNQYADNTDYRQYGDVTPIQLLTLEELWDGGARSYLAVADLQNKKVTRWRIWPGYVANDIRGHIREKSKHILAPWWEGNNTRSLWRYLS